MTELKADALLREALAAAYVQGATDVHNEWSDNPLDADFGEAGSDYAASVTLSQQQGRENPCTCHPDDRPEGPCPRKYAASECQTAAHIEARDARIASLEDALLPCPFCGREPKVQDFRETSDETGEVYGYAAVECNHGNPTNGGIYFHCDTLPEAITAWNTRHPAMTEQTQSKSRLTDEYLAMTPAQKWDCLIVNGLIGTDEPWIEDMRSALKARDARIASQDAEIERLRELVKPLAKRADYADFLESYDDELLETLFECRLFRAARKALEGKNNEDHSQQGSEVMEGAALIPWLIWMAWSLSSIADHLKAIRQQGEER